MTDKTIYEMLVDLQSVLSESERRTDLKEVVEFLNKNKNKTVLELITEYPERHPQFQTKGN